ncbi:hypothetical protein DFQ28_008422 [Apophysomyces sp. BC1034]|nr:hypothetical protein DFQ28_008422 [Apophysomyces sp. BC1034]
MLMDLCRSADRNPNNVNKLEVIGYLHHGPVAQHLVLENPRGYICRLTQSKKFQVPSLPVDFALALELMAMSLKLKKRAERTISNLWQRPFELGL